MQETYRALKKKYRPWIDKWAAKTDPLKFVYEDIGKKIRKEISVSHCSGSRLGIAAHLICLWEIERMSQKSETEYKKPSFVDLGCGNGFLVYLLNSEGYPGK
jgi:tRNASer (uridine44-2'-O)-methyltransferase